MSTIHLIEKKNRETPGIYIEKKSEDFVNKLKISVTFRKVSERHHEILEASH